MPVPGTLIQPNLTILAEVDPANAVAETNESDNAFPSAGTPLALDVRPTSAFAVRFVRSGRTPTASRATSPTPAWPATFPLRCGCIRSPHMPLRYGATKLMTDAPAVQSNSSTAWTQILNELRAARTSDGDARYYYGVVKPGYSSGIAGIGYVGLPVAIGWDKSGADQVAAHEWGHNWGRQHAPCGDAGNPDLNYPYANGIIGVYGFDVAAQSIKPPTYSDLMGYCNNEWISDYTYLGVLNYRGTHADVESAFAQAMQPCLLVWGRIVDGQPVLEPAFQVVTRPSLPAAPGPYTVEGRAADGSSVFRVSFAPDPVADDPAAGAQFAFAVPLQPDRAERLVAMHLVERGRRIASVRASAGAAAAAARVEASRLGGGRVGLRWDASAHPMLMVRDPVTGEVLSFARGGRSEVVTDRGELDLQLSTGVRGRSMRLALPRAMMRPRMSTRALVVAASVALAAACARPASPGPSAAGPSGAAGQARGGLGGAHHARAAPLLRDLSRVLGHAGRLGRGAVRGPALRGGHGNLDRQRARGRESTAWWRISPPGGTSTSPTATPPASPAASGTRPTCPR